MLLELSRFWESWSCHFSSYLHSGARNLTFFKMWFGHSYINRSFWFAFYPPGLPWSTRREGWCRRKGRKGDLSIPACACLIFLMPCALLFNLGDSFIYLIFLHPVLQKHTNAWSKKTRSSQRNEEGYRARNKGTV